LYGRVLTRVPRYLELAGDLKARIAAGETQVGGLMPTEHDLCQRYAVSRYTVREALRILAEQGLVARRQGSGTVVLSTASISAYRQSVTAGREILSFGQDAAFQFEQGSEVVADHALAEVLGCAPGTVWKRLHGIGRRSDMARSVGIIDVFFSQRVESVAQRFGPADRPYFQQLEAFYGVSIARLEQHFQASLLDADQAQRLKTQIGAPALRIIRRYFEADAPSPFAVSISVHPGDLYTFTMALTNPDRMPDS
jgi:GntR family transcriptional regulator